MNAVTNKLAAALELLRKAGASGNHQGIREAIKACEDALAEHGQAEKDRQHIDLLEKTGVCSAEQAMERRIEHLTQPAAAQEAVVWSKTKPTAEGAYYVRGFNLFQLAQYEALVQVRTHHFDGEPAPELVCNIHESTSNADMDDWSPIVEMSEDFEWLGPLFAAPVAAAPVVPVDSDAFDYLVDEVAAEHGEMLDDGGPSGWSFTCEGLAAFAKHLMSDYKGVLVADAYAIARAEAKRDSTPAAPGIDLAERVLCVLIEEGVLARNGRVFQKLRALIDASPKGGSTSAPRFELTNGQIAQLADFAGTPVAGAPLDEQDVLVIQHAEAGHSGPGLYAHYDELPEEGAIHLDGQLPDSPKAGSDERARFEAWAEKHRRLSCPGYLARHALSGAYCIQVTDTAWDAWQASLQATSAEVGP